MPRASACTEETLLKWYIELEQFLLLHDLHGKPDCIWNCDESRFPLCPKSGKVLAPRGTKTMYRTCSAKKEQITTLVAISASEGIIPPFHIFSGERFSYNPLEGAVEGAYFGRSPNGWITTELFYGWVANHFATQIGPRRPVVLLFDGHSTHINLKTSRFCKDNDILLFCLPVHSSHIMQALNVGFFKPLKLNWAHAVYAFRVANVGQTVTKQVFARIFKPAWIDSVKARSIVNAFAGSGVYPVDKSKAKSTKTAPSKIFINKEDDTCGKELSTTATSSAKLALRVLEEQMDGTIVKKYEERFDEKYDVQDDLLYNAWSNLKQQVLTSLDSAKLDSAASKDPDLSNPLPEFKSLTISPAFDEVLQYPDPIPRKTSNHTRGTSHMPHHLTSDQVIQYLADKKKKKLEAEEAKELRKMQKGWNVNARRKRRGLNVSERRQRRKHRTRQEEGDEGKGGKGQEQEVWANQDLE